MSSSSSLHYLGRNSSHRDILSLRMKVSDVAFSHGAAASEAVSGAQQRVVVHDQLDDALAGRRSNGAVQVQSDVLIGLLLLSPRASINGALRGTVPACQKSDAKKK